MERQRGFQKVSRFENAEIQLPERSTKNSAGYDFYAPEDVIIPPSFPHPIDVVKQNGPFIIKTGVKAYMGDDEVLNLYMRSSAPKKLGLVMANSVGIIDSDYYNNSDNEGEIGFLVYNLGPDPVTIKKGEKLGQGVFTKFLKADDDTAVGSRSGGFGSTGK